jgi:hypothetical protein
MRPALKRRRCGRPYGGWRGDEDAGACGGRHHGRAAVGGGGRHEAVAVRALAPIAVLFGVMLVVVVLTLTGVLGGDARPPLSTSTTVVTIQLLGPEAR